MLQSIKIGFLGFQSKLKNKNYIGLMQLIFDLSFYSADDAFSASHKEKIISKAKLILNSYIFVIVGTPFPESANFTFWPSCHTDIPAVQNEPVVCFR